MNKLLPGILKHSNVITVEVNCHRKINLTEDIIHDQITVK